ncbi:hypothetical protein Pfo_026306 [Paulownia fortunei]|nr:hypothetical protein Pfo_026306 [Paulownia fortunei]
MLTISSISSNLFKKSFPIYASTSINPLHFCRISKKNLTIAQYGTQSRAFASSRVVGLAHDPSYIPGKSPPEIPTAPPVHKPGIPPEVPRTPNVPDFDPIPPEKPADPPPSPEFPGPPDPIPPKPEAPPPQIPSPPGEPEVIPPHGPDVIPPNPPEPGPPYLTQSDIPPPIMGSDGLVFY